jgi:TRAP-type mannitol/chloroaromatic compound transport system permease small subunit
MGILTAFARIVTTANLWVARVMHWGVLILFVLLLFDVVMRKLVGAPDSISQQASRLLFGVYAILGGGYLMARREHVNVDLFYGNFSRRKKALVDILTFFLFFLMMWVLLTESFSLAVDSTMRLEQDHLAIWKAPLWPSKCLIVVAAALLFLQGIVKLAADFLILFGHDPDEEAFGPIKDGDATKVDV